MLNSYKKNIEIINYKLKLVNSDYNNKVKNNLFIKFISD